MRTRLLTPVVLVLLALTACGGGDGKITIGDAAPSETVDTSGDDGTTPADESATDDTVAAEPTDRNSTAVADVDKCIEVSEAFSGVAASATNMTPEDAQAAIDTMTSVLPADLVDDMQTMIDAYAAGPAEIGQALSSQEFLDANTAVTDYLAQICGGG